MTPVPSDKCLAGLSHTNCSAQAAELLAKALRGAGPRAPPVGRLTGLAALSCVWDVESGEVAAWGQRATGRGASSLPHEFKCEGEKFTAT